MKTIISLSAKAAGPKTSATIAQLSASLKEIDKQIAALTKQREKSQRAMDKLKDSDKRSLEEKLVGYIKTAGYEAKLSTSHSFISSTGGQSSERRISIKIPELTNSGTQLGPISLFKGSNGWVIHIQVNGPSHVHDIPVKTTASGVKAGLAQMRKVAEGLYAKKNPVAKPRVKK